MDDGAAEAALGVVDGRLDAVDFGEGPSAGQSLSRVVGDRAGVAVAGLVFVAFVLSSARYGFAFERRDPLFERSTVAVLFEDPPGDRRGVRRSAGRCSPSSFLGGHPFGVSGEVTHEVRPAHLSSPGGGLLLEAHQRSEVVTPENRSPRSPSSSRWWRSGAIRSSAWVELKAPQRVRLPPRSRQPVSSTLTAPAACIWVLSAAYGSASASPVRCTIASTVPVDRSTRRTSSPDGTRPDHACRHAVTRTEGVATPASNHRKTLPARTTGRELGPSDLAAARAADPLEPMLGHNHADRQQLRNLMTRRLTSRHPLLLMKHVQPQPRRDDAQCSRQASSTLEPAGTVDHGRDAPAAPQALLRRRPLPLRPHRRGEDHLARQQRASSRKLGSADAQAPLEPGKSLLRSAASEQRSRSDNATSAPQPQRLRPCCMSRLRLNYAPPARFAAGPRTASTPTERTTRFGTTSRAIRI